MNLLAPARAEILTEIWARRAVSRSDGVFHYCTTPAGMLRHWRLGTTVMISNRRRAGSSFRPLHGVAWVALLLGACANAEDAARGVVDSGVSSGPAGGASEPPDTAEPSAPRMPPATQCPAPKSPLTSGGPQWARDPQSGVCCEYPGIPGVPDLWPYFPTRDACENECRCSQLDDFIEDVGLFNTERTSLECRCTSVTCPATFEEASAALCAGGASVVRFEGCGMIGVGDSNGYFGQGWVFDGAGGALVGAYSFTDVNSDPCQTYEWVAGREFVCETASECHLCGPRLVSTRPDCE